MSNDDRNAHPTKEWAKNMRKSPLLYDQKKHQKDRSILNNALKALRKARKRIAVLEEQIHELEPLK